MTTESSYSVAIQQWKNVNLNAVQRDLDEQGLAIVENQKDGIVSRKRLAEHTREFKKLSDEDKLQQFKSLLKGYQSEIDNVTRRTKYAENAFLTIYKLLADVPDPLPLFEAAVEQSAKAVDHQQLETRVKDLQDQLAKHEQVHQINDQLVQENAQLKQKVSQLETRMEDKKAEDLVKKEQELKSQYNAKIIHYKEKEHDLQLQLNQALTHLNQLQVTHDNTQAQLIDHNQQYHQDVVGKLAELDVVMMDMERANARIIELENRNNDLKMEITSIREENHGQTIDARVQDTQHETDLNRLIKDVDTYKNLLQKTETRNSKKIKELAAETKSLMDQNTSLQAKIKEFDDYHEIKRELNIMKYVEFSNGDEDEDEFDAKEVLAASAHGSLEVQLMDKNKKLENNYTQLRVQFKQLQQSFDENQNKLEALDSKCTEQQDLVQRLEEDLLRGVGPKAPIRQLPSRTSSPNPNAMITGQASVTAASSTGTAPLPVGNTTDDQSILPIVMQQRDRFRQRNNELEQKARSLEQKLYDVQGEMDHLRQDNVKLYERLKFVHVWKEEQRVQNRSTMIPMADLDGPSNRRTGEMDRYDKIYEENMNPFAQFHRKEEKRRLNAMSLADKLTLKMTRVMFSQKWTRYFMIGYALLLHLLVVTTLYQLSLWECRHDHEAFNLPQK